MDQTTHDIRRTTWLSIITECQQRPTNITAKQWLADNGIKEKSYYYWLRKFRKEACNQMQFPDIQYSSHTTDVSFAEIHIPAYEPKNNVGHTVATVRFNGIAIDITANISESLVRILMQEVLHA